MGNETRNMQRHMALASGIGSDTTISCIKILSSWPNEAKNSCVLRLLISVSMWGSTKRRSIGCRISRACSTPPSRQRAKTVLSRMVKALVDPNVAPVRALPRDERELFISASNGHVLAFDNLSGLPAWLSDTLCRLASGGAFSTRRLFTDQDEILFTAARPVILNGIEDIITRPDLADRAILLGLAPIAERQRRPEHVLWREFELARPHILGALVDAAAYGLRMRPHVRLQRLPRMADFALWAAACEGAFRPASAFEAAYSNNRRDAIENIVDADPVAAHVRELMADRAQWTGSASDLLQAGTDRSGWPRTPAHLPAACVGHRPSCAHSGLRLSSAARGGWERAQSR